MRLGVLGGTFDPVHVGHLILAECAREQFNLDEVRFIPAGDPWRKAQQEVSNAGHRLAMVRLAVEGNTRFRVDASEVERPGASYTAETLTALRASLAAKDSLYFLLGHDALEDLRYWRDPETIVAAARLAVAPRVAPQAPAGPHTPTDFPTPQYHEIEMPHIGISSTALRERVRAGLSIRYMVPRAVEEYIDRWRLYRQS